ncbi:MAG: hypothetical protein N2318_02500 [Meiothermus sp.]|nr:hypothetical protein [Meiothermus sp.]
MAASTLGSIDLLATISLAGCIDPILNSFLGYLRGRTALPLW